MYLFPILSFMMGVFISDTFQYRVKFTKMINWRQGIVLTEVAIMILVGFLPHDYSTIANCMISCSCAMQLNTFKQVHNNSYASTMCIGNLRSGVAALSSFLRTGAKEQFSAAKDYLPDSSINES